MTPPYLKGEDGYYPSLFVRCKPDRRARDDELRSLLTGSNPLVAGGGNESVTDRVGVIRRLLKKRAESDLGYRADVQSDVASGPLTDRLGVLTGPRRIGKSVVLLDAAAALCRRSDGADIGGHLLAGRAGTVSGRRIRHLHPMNFRALVTATRPIVALPPAALDEATVDAALAVLRDMFEQRALPTASNGVRCRSCNELALSGHERVVVAIEADGRAECSTRSGSESVVDRRRFEQIYDDYSGLILAYAARRTRDPEDAADVTAETFMVAWRRIDVVPPGDEARPWLYGIARLVLANRRRSLDRRSRLDGKLRAEVGQDCGHTDEDAIPTVRALDRLREGDRELHWWEGNTLPHCV
jgi:hypothetical protein